MKKKVLAIIAAASMVMASLAGCGGSAAPATTAAAKAAAATTAAPAATTKAAAATTAATATTKAAAATTAAAAATTAAAAAKDGVKADKAFYDAIDLSTLKGKKLGITIQSLQNAYWAGVMSALKEVLDANGASYTIVACDDNSEKQIGQIENFISSKCDLIMVHPSDANAVEDACKKAKDAGIKVMCWDDPMTNTDGNWILDNTALGHDIGVMAGEFINAHYSADKKAQVCVIGYPQTKVLLERANGIKAGLKDTSDGKYEIVAEQAGVEANKVQTAVETVLQAHPDCKVVAGIGAGAMIGANEALITYYKNKIPEDCGVFTTDVTKQQLTQLLSGDQASKGIIGFEGSDVDTATACAKMYAAILGGKLTAKNVYRGTSRMTKDNAQAVLSQMK